jgi:hypothetical protein
MTTTLEDIFFETSGIILLKKKQLGNSMKINEAINDLLTPLIVSFLKEFLCPGIFYLFILQTTCNFFIRRVVKN